MTDSQTPIGFVDAMTTVSAFYCGIDSEVELVCWLRGSLGRMKLLAVQAVRAEEAYCLGYPDRSFEVAELEVPVPDIVVLTELLRNLGFPHRVPRLQDTSSAESIWGARLSLTVRVNGEPSRLEVGLGPEGVRGEDAESLRAFFRVLLDAGRCRDELLRDLLTRPQPDF